MTLIFPDHCGLCLVRGRNEVDFRLGSNGAGKSTIWDALVWCLQGKTARGLASGTVESWNSDGTPCEVSTALEIAGEVRIVQRTRSPISLTLDGKPVGQEEIDDLIGLSFERFLQVVLMGQFGKFFPDMKPADRLSLLSEVLDLEEWTRLSKVAATAVKSYEVELQGHEASAAGMRGRREAVQEAASRAREDSEGYEAARKERLLEANEGLDEAETEVSTITVKVKKVRAKIRDGVATLEDAEAVIGNAVKSRRNITSKLDQLEGRLHELHTNRGKVAGRVEKARGSITGKCPTCHQPLGSYREAVLQTLDLEIVDLDRAIEITTVERDKLAEQDDVAKKLVHECDRALSEASQLKADVERQLATASSRRKTFVERVERLHEEIEGIEGEENPHGRALERAEVELCVLDAAIEESEVIQFDVQTQLDLIDFWPRGFKELRLWVIDQALDELSVHANNSLVELGLPDWRIEFSVERETQRGTISRGFGINVRSPESPDAVPWEAWSGGETQRLRVACAVGLSELIRSRMPDAPVIEVWDEPTEHLNEPDGVRDLVEFFSARSDTRQVWLIDHRALDSGAFDHVVTVVKEATGSRVET